ncbi:MAG: zinc-ribbon domain-containing protein [Pyrinomonadaceae bacterium]
MSIILCPECRSEVSAQAVTCPKCGYPLAIEPDTVIITPTPPPVVEPLPVVVREVITEEKSNFPAWALVPIALALVVVIFGLIWMMNRNQTDANDNANVRITAAANSRTTRTAEQIPSTVNPPAGSTVVVPSTTNPSTGDYPSSVPPTVPTNLPPAGSETVVTNPAPPDKGNLMLTATVLTSKGTKLPVKAEKFYLLSKDLETILSSANIEATEGSYASTLGAVIADPNRKDELEKCLAAINPYIVAKTLSDSTGNASFKNVKPDSYYLFGVHKTGNSASVWNTSVAVNPGENTIALNGSVPAPAPPITVDSNQ